MSPLSLLTICVGMTCNITESNVPYTNVADREYSNSILDLLKTARIRLEGFSEWFNTTVNSSLTTLQNSIDINVNMPLMDIQDLIENSVQESHEIEKCYTTAVTNIKEIALRKLPAVEDCVQIFNNYTAAMKTEISQKLNEMADLQSRIELTIPECEAGPSPDDCMQSRTNDVVVAVNSYEEYSRTTTEQGAAKLYEKRDDAMDCQGRPLIEVQKEGDTVRSEADICIRYA